MKKCVVGGFVSHLIMLCMIFKSTYSQQLRPCAINNQTTYCSNGGSCFLKTNNDKYCICTSLFTGVRCQIGLSSSYYGYDHLRPAVANSTSLQDLQRVGTGKALQPGQQLSLKCRLAVFPLGSHRFDWLLNGTVLDSEKDPNLSINHTTGDLSVKNPSQNRTRYEGVYSCLVTSDFGVTRVSNIQVKVIVLGSFTSSSPIQLNVTINARLALKCPPHSYSHGVNYDWISQATQKPIQLDKSRVIKAPDGTLYFSQVTEEDVKQITETAKGIRCRMSWDGGKQLSAVVTLKKLAIPQGGSDPPYGCFDLPRPDIFVGPFYTTLLHCFPYGRSPISIVWQKDSLPVTPNAEYQVVALNRTLKVISRNTSVAGKYTAVVKAGLSPTKTSASFVIRVLESRTNYLHVQIKESVTMDCSRLIKFSLGVPYVWYFNGKPFRLNSRSRYHGNGSLTIRPLQMEDFGIYQCFVDDKESNFYSLYVVGAPFPPISLSITNCSKWTTTLSWSLNRGQPSQIHPPSSYIVEISSQFTPNVYTKLQDVNGDTKVDIKGLNPGTALAFRVKGKNDIGVGLPSIPSPLCVTLPDKPTTVPQGLKALPNTNSGVMNVTWNAVRRINWNADTCNIIVYTKLNSESVWKNQAKVSCADSKATLFRLGNYKLTDVKIQMVNPSGSGPNSTVVTAYSGQYPPNISPKNLTIKAITPYNVSLQWDKVVLTIGSVDEYLIVYNEMSVIQPVKKRRRRSIIVETWQKFLSLILPSRARHRRQLRVASSNPNKSIRVKGTQATITGLRPYTFYTIKVGAVNSGGTGRSTSLPRIKTLYNVDSIYLLSYTFVATFTAEYEDETSLEYRNLSNAIISGIKSQVVNDFWVRSFEILSFRNGSIVTDIQIVAATPTHQDLFKLVEANSKHFSPYVLDTSKTAITKEPNFTNPNISVSNRSPSSGSTIELNCTFTQGPQQPTFLWGKDKSFLVPDARHKILSDYKQSILTIRKINPGDEGNYICIVRKASLTATSESIAVKVKPVISIVPMAITKVEGESATFTCLVVSGDIGSMKLVLVKPGPEPTKMAETDKTTFSDLRISNGKTSQIITYQCLLVLDDLKNPVSKSPLADLTIVKASFPKCPSEVAAKVLWSSTASGVTDVQRCPGNATGQATRRCVGGPDSKPTWSEPNFGNCTSLQYQNYLLQAEAIISSDYTPSYNASGLLQVLENATETGTIKKKTGLNGGDVAVTIKILSLLVNSSQTNNNTDISSSQDQQNFLETCSNCLESKNAQSWMQYEDQRQQGTKTLWNQMVVTVNRYGLQLTNQMDRGSALVETANIALRLDRVKQHNKEKVNGLKFDYSEFSSSVFLPPEVFSNGSDHQVVSLVYKTLNAVMRLKNTTNTTQVNRSIILPPNTTIVTSVVSPPPTGKLKNKVKIIVKNKRVVQPVPPRTCVFWREGLPSTWNTHGCSLVPSESNQHVTTCECDHLTVFAALMDPYGAPIPQDHRQALELISTIGCAISLFGVVMTILVTWFFWRALKTPRTIVLMNICVAIAAVCILVIAEGTARHTKVGCTVLAVLLHYFLLAVFCWMLCEGALLYLIIVKVIGGKVEEKVKFFLLFGWGFPLLIVGISLAVTQTRGYGYYGDQTACWLAVDSGLIWAFVGPALIVLLINMVVFILVIRQMMGTRHAQNKSRDEKLLMGVKATAVVLPLLGITWLFGLLAFNSAVLAFKYIFAIFNSLQGLMIFIFHCVLNQQVQDAFKRKFNQYSSSDSSKDSHGRNKKTPAQDSDITSKESKNMYEMDRRKKDPKREELILTSKTRSESDVVVIGNTAQSDVEQRKNKVKQDELAYSEIQDGVERVPQNHIYDNLQRSKTSSVYNHDSGKHTQGQETQRINEQLSLSNLPLESEKQDAKSSRQPKPHSYQNPALIEDKVLGYPPSCDMSIASASCSAPDTSRIDIEINEDSDSVQSYTLVENLQDLMSENRIDSTGNILDGSLDSSSSGEEVMVYDLLAASRDVFNDSEQSVQRVTFLGQSQV